MYPYIWLHLICFKYISISTVCLSYQLLSKIGKFSVFIILFFRYNKFLFLVLWNVALPRDNCECVFCFNENQLSYKLKKKYAVWKPPFNVCKYSRWNLIWDYSYNIWESGERCLYAKSPLRMSTIMLTESSSVRMVRWFPSTVRILTSFWHTWKERENMEIRYGVNRNIFFEGNKDLQILADIFESKRRNEVKELVLKGNICFSCKKGSFWTIGSRIIQKYSPPKDRNQLLVWHNFQWVW